MGRTVARGVTEIQFPFLCLIENIFCAFIWLFLLVLKYF